jgi:hypothetical protein
MWRRHDWVPIVVEEEKHATSPSIQVFCLLGGALPVAASMPNALGRMAHTLRLASWERALKTIPASFLTPVERAHQVRGFSLALFV